MSANELDDSYAFMLNKIMSSHQEYKDEQIWAYGLRDERPPRVILSSLKKFNLSHNQLTVKAIRVISRTIKSDNYCRCLNLSGNNLNVEAVTELYDALQDNHAMFNMDLRLNPGLS